MIPARADLPPHRHPDSERIGRWTAAFEQPAIEGAFRRSQWSTDSARLRTVSVLGATFMLGFGYTDYLALGFGPVLAVSWSLRLLLFFAALGVAGLSRRQSPPRYINPAILALVMTFAVVLCTVVALQPHGLMAQVPGAVLMTLAFYLFLPAPFVLQVFGGLFTSTGFLVVGGLTADPSLRDLLVSGLELAACNVLGCYTSHQAHIHRRREFLGYARLQEHVLFEELIARLSTHFISIDSSQVGTAVDEALEEIGEFAGADRSYVIEFDWEQNRFSCTHEWARASVSREIDNLQEIPVEAFSWCNTRIANGEVVLISSIAELPDSVAAEQEEFRRQGIQSLALVPLMVDGETVGLVGFDAVRQARHWDDDLVMLLQLVGEMIVNVLRRQQTESDLLRNQRALEAANAALEASRTEV